MSGAVQMPSLCGAPACVGGFLLVELGGFSGRVYVVLKCPTCEAVRAAKQGRADQAQIKQEAP